MKYGNNKIDEIGYQLISLINDENLERLNKIFGTHYMRKGIEKQIRVSRKKEDFNFFDRLMRQKSRSRL